MAKGSVRRKKADEYAQRLAKHYDELKWLYCELYNGREDMFEQLCERMMQWYAGRSEALKRLDREREANPDWYKKQDMLGMMLYIDAFSENISNLEKKLAYLKECNVNYLHLMPFLKTPKGKSDGGYAVADYRTVQENLGTMAQLDSLAQKCHKKGISLCMDFVMNHTSEEHEWAQRALAGDKEYQDRYFFFDSYEIPAEYEKTCPQVFPTTAPGNFTWRADCKKYVMTTFYPYQWDLNYANPVVFNEMVYNMLYLVNRGIDIVRIDAVPYIWKQLGTSCRNLPQVHTIVRMMRMITEIVCPGVVLLGEVVMEPEKVVPYFGTVEKPECHMLYNVTTMATIWHTVAARKVSLLRHQMDVINDLPGEYVFLNYLRCHDDIGWGLEYGWLEREGMEEVPHKKFLNAYFTGNWPGSMARGELYNDDPESGDARLCGTTASLCGLEGAMEQKDKEAAHRAVDCDLMLHACILTLSGIPMLYSGDEVGQLNDYSYKEDPAKAADSRYVHRGKFNWAAAAKRTKKGTVQNRLFQGILHMEQLRKKHRVFSNDASVRTVETHDPALLCLVRELNGEKLIALFNFSEEEKTAWTDEPGIYTDLLSGKTLGGKDIPMLPYGARWMFYQES